MENLFGDIVSYYRKAEGIFSQVRTANYDTTFILLDLYYPTTIQNFTPANEEIETIYHYNRRTGKVTQIVTGQENEKYGELILLYSDYVTLKRMKTAKLSLLGHKLLIAEKIGDMSESIIRSGMAGSLWNDICDMDAINIYQTLITGVGHPARQVDADKYEIRLTLTYRRTPVFIDAGLPF